MYLFSSNIAASAPWIRTSAPSIDTRHLKMFKIEFMAFRLSQTSLAHTHTHTCRTDSNIYERPVATEPMKIECNRQRRPQREMAHRLRVYAQFYFYTFSMRHVRGPRVFVLCVWMWYAKCSANVKRHVGAKWAFDGVCSKQSWQTAAGDERTNKRTNENNEWLFRSSSACAVRSLRFIYNVAPSAPLLLNAHLNI